MSVFFKQMSEYYNAERCPPCVSRPQFMTLKPLFFLKNVLHVMKKKIIKKAARFWKAVYWCSWEYFKPSL